jgi:adenylate cyclase
MARFVITQPGGQIQVFEITQPSVQIGRAESNDLVLDHASVSRRHSRLEAPPDDPCVLRDLGSLNGTLVNGQRIEQHQLSNHDQIQIGIYQLHYECADEQAMHVEVGNRPDAQLAGLASPENLDAALRRGSEDAGQTVVGSMEDRLRAVERENKLLKILAGVGKALATALTTDDAMRLVMELVFRLENVERGFVMLTDKEKGGFKPAVMLYKDERLRSDGQGVALSQNLVRRVMSERLPLLIYDVASDLRFSASESLRVSGVRSAMCAPLMHKDNFYGLFYVDCLTRPYAFSKEELNVFSVIAVEAALSFENALAHEELARRAVERKALERFLSTAVVEKIQANPHSVRLGGENQVATILFTDIRGFTRIAEQMEPQQVVELLNEYFSEMTELVFEFGGTLDKYMGDGLMALFGTPIARPDDAVRAIKAGIEMQRGLARLNQEWRNRGRMTLDIGIGINTGPVTAGNIGSARRMDFTVIGDAVNLASRLCAQAEGGQILVSDSTCALVNGQFPLYRLEPLFIKGKEKPVEVYEVAWSGARQPSLASGG